MSEFAITAIGVDRPGIVAAVAAALLEIGGNVEDSAMTILGGHFSIVLLAQTPVDRDALSAALAERTDGFGLTVTVSEVGEGNTSASSSHVLSVYGADKPGILAGVTRALADIGANVTDLETRLLNAAEDPIYAMVIELWTDDEATVRTTLTACCDELGVDHTLRRLDAETL
ncbi:MAG: glycine cleavage system transcriptional repressor [Glaciecola sp.]|jgi:glycine cleavage system transcriptional repressor